MADRYRSDNRSLRDRYQRGGYGRQEEQFQSDYGYGDERSHGQMGDSWRDEYGEQQSGWGSREERQDRDRGYYGANERAYRRGGGSGSYGPSYGANANRGYSSFTGNDFGGRDFNAPQYTADRTQRAAAYGAGSQLARSHGEWHDRDADYRGYSPPTRYGRAHEDEDRGFLERAGDKLASWLGDDETRDWRDTDHRGRGPSNYTRSDERIQEDACDRLTQDWRVDARNVTVKVENAEVTLDGTVTSRDQKRRAEDCVEDITGVRHVQNNLRVQERSSWDRNNSGDQTTGGRGDTTAI